MTLSRDRRASVIPPTFRGARQAKRELNLLKWHLNPGRKDLKSSQWKGAKRQLSAETFGKCAYCDAPAASVAYCDVEHYRPKSVYWWLALCYDNYLFACQICNQVYKGNAFPTYGTALTAPHVDASMTDAQLSGVVGTFAPDPLDAGQVAHFTALWAAEQPGLFNPYVDDPELIFGYEVDPDLKEVKVVPLEANVVELQRIADDSIRLYGLNREQLRRERFIEYEALKLTYLAHLEHPGSMSIMNLLQRQICPDFRFHRMNRYFVRRVWTIPGL
ncbi:hypothetical protein [Deinococcus aquaticus]|uniref:hypothetical protein n=1 Tax=Deinococcus aquaticus TaxID=328692 RepID=UPI003F46190A